MATSGSTTTAGQSPPPYPDDHVRDAIARILAEGILEDYRKELATESSVKGDLMSPSDLPPAIRYDLE
jgi:hypothetical protein